jgi:hypothetical protein
MELFSTSASKVHLMNICYYHQDHHCQTCPQSQQTPRQELPILPKPYSLAVAIHKQSSPKRPRHLRHPRRTKDYDERRAPQRRRRRHFNYIPTSGAYNDDDTDVFRGYEEYWTYDRLGTLLLDSLGTLLLDSLGTLLLDDDNDDNFNMTRHHSSFV